MGVAAAPARKFYTGVGSRQTPKAIRMAMHRLAGRLRKADYTLRSGGARGADTFFAMNAGDKRQIFIPWDGFNGMYREIDRGSWLHIFDINKEICREALDLARKHHPAWELCGVRAMHLHARNAFQVLGPDLSDPSEFLVCWTPDGAERAEDTSEVTGGTGTAIRIASAYKVPVYNLRNRDSQFKIKDLLSSIEG